MAQGGALLGVMGVIGAAGALATLALWHSDNPPSPATVAAAEELGLTPATLAACGLDAEDAESLLVAIANEETGVAALDAAHTAADAALAALVTKQALFDADPTDGEVRSALASAHQTLAAAQAQVVSARMDLYADVLNGVEGSGKVGKCKGATGYAVPRCYQVLAQTHEEWILSEWAVNEVVRADREGGEAPQGAEAKVSGLDSEPDVAAAKTGLQNNLGAIEAVFGSHKG